MEFTLKDILDPEMGMKFIFPVPDRGMMIGHIHSIKGKAITMTFQAGDGTQFINCKREDVKIYLEDKYRRVSQASLFHGNLLKIDRRTDLTEAFSVVIGEGKITLGPTLLDLLKLYTDKDQKLSVSFGTTENSSVVIIPFYDGKGDYIIDSDTGIGEGNFESVDLALQESGYNIEKLREMFNEVESLEGCLKFVAAFSVQTGANLVPYISFTLPREFAEKYETKLMENPVAVAYRKKKLKSYSLKEN